MSNKDKLREWRKANPDKARKIQREYRARNPEKVKEWNKRARNKIRKRNDKIIRKAKNRPCCDCGLSYPYYVMDFDHVRGKKEFNLGTPGLASVEKIMKEIAKCEVVCSNCHRIRTYGNSRKAD